MADIFSDPGTAANGGWSTTASTPDSSSGFTFGASQFSAIGGAVSDIFGGIAQQEADDTKAQGAAIEAENYGLASKLAGENAQFSQESTAIKTVQQNRAVLMAQGSTQADVGGAGFANSGSALDIMRMNASQGALAAGVIQTQGAITTAGYQEQGDAYANMQKAATLEEQADKQAGENSFIGGIIGGITQLAPLALMAL